MPTASSPISVRSPEKWRKCCFWTRTCTGPGWGTGLGVRHEVFVLGQPAGCVGQQDLAAVEGRSAAMPGLLKGRGVCEGWGSRTGRAGSAEPNP